MPGRVSNVGGGCQFSLATMVAIEAKQKGWSNPEKIIQKTKSRREPVHASPWLCQTRVATNPSKPIKRSYKPRLVAPMIIIALRSWLKLCVQRKVSIYKVNIRKVIGVVFLLTESELGVQHFVATNVQVYVRSSCRNSAFGS